MLKRRVWVGAFALTTSVALTTALSWVAVERGGMPLDGVAAVFVYALTETGGARVVPALLVLALWIWATDPGLPVGPRRKDWIALLLVLGLTLPTVALLVELVVKPRVAEPRPSHLAMTQTGLIPDLDAFYALDKSARREFLLERANIGGAEIDNLGLHPVILAHWLHESGSTFPSAHALNAFIAAALFTAGGVAAPSLRRRRLAVWLLAWSCVVSLSRVLLGVHRPVDVAVGAAAGAVVGVMLALLWWRWTHQRSFFTSRP